MYQVLKGDMCLPDPILADELSLLNSTNPQPVGCRTQWQWSVTLLHPRLPLSYILYGLRSGAVRMGTSFGYCFCIYRFPAFFWLLCLLWLAVIGWINGRWCLWWHPPADPCGGIILCNNLLWLRTLQKQFKAFPQKTWKLCFSKSLRGLNK